MMIPKSNVTSPVESPATTPMDEYDPKRNLTHVINSIYETLSILHQLYHSVSSFDVASQLPLHLLNNLVLKLDNMTRLVDKCNIRVPMEVLNLIDDGKNPDKSTRDLLNGYALPRIRLPKGKRISSRACEGICLRNWSRHFLMKLKLIGRYVQHLQLRPNNLHAHKARY